MDKAIVYVLIIITVVLGISSAMQLGLDIPEDLLTVIVASLTALAYFIAK